MDRYKETFETWNKVAELYEGKFMHMDIYNHTYDYLCNSVEKPNAKILEVGCGPGNVTKYLLNRRPDFKISGIDIAPKMIELAKKNNPVANFAVMDCRQLETIKKTYDAIVCGFCLPYLSQADCTKFIFNCYNLLHKNALLYISFVEGDSAASGFQVGSSGNRVYFYYHDYNQIKDLLAKNNFYELKTFKIEYKRTETEQDSHTIIVARKNSLV